MKETQLLFPVKHSIKMREKLDKKPQSATMELRKYHKLFAYLRTINLIIIAENTGIMTKSLLHKKNCLNGSCLLLILLPCIFYENLCVDIAGLSDIKKTKQNTMEKNYLRNLI